MPPRAHLPVDAIAPHLERRELPRCDASQTEDGPLCSVHLHGHLIGWIWDRLAVELDGGAPIPAWLIVSLPAKRHVLVPGSLDDASFALAHHALDTGAGGTC